MGARGVSLDEAAGAGARRFMLAEHAESFDGERLALLRERPVRELAPDALELAERVSRSACA